MITFKYKILNLKEEFEKEWNDKKSWILFGEENDKICIRWFDKNTSLGQIHSQKNGMYGFRIR